MLLKPVPPNQEARSIRPGSRRYGLAALARCWTAFARRWPFKAFILVIACSNGLGSLFNILYNHQFMAEPRVTAAQEMAFTYMVLPAYNVVAYSYCGVVI